MVALEGYSFRLDHVPSGISVHIFDPGEESVAFIENQRIESIESSAQILYGASPLRGGQLHGDRHREVANSTGPPLLDSQLDWVGVEGYKS